MRTVALPQRFDLIIISINTFMHLLTTIDQVDALTNLARHLTAEGQLIIDLPAGDELVHQDPDARLTLDTFRHFIGRLSPRPLPDEAAEPDEA